MQDDNSCEDKKLVVRKQNFLNGGDRSLIDYNYAHSIPNPLAKVVKPMYVKGFNAWIGIDALLLPKEVITVGFNNTKYRLTTRSKKLMKTLGYDYNVVRVDGQPITFADINNIQVGQRVKLSSRRSKDQIFGQLYRTLNIDTNGL